MPEGQIIRALSSFYYVKSENNIWECKARGVFKKRKLTPVVGDYVVFEKVDDNKGLITEIKPRKNELIRPQISNVDQAILVFSAKEPNFSSLLLDRFLVLVEQANIKPIICITKLDLVEDMDELNSKLKVYEDIGYQVIRTSKLGVGITEIKEVLKGKVSVFSGQSGVGKSTLLNTISPELYLETANISQKLGRGKHTTRVVQLITLPSGGTVADTPGFSSLDFHGINSKELDKYFIEIAELSTQCRFRGCLHLSEPGCAVKEAVEEGQINKERYEHYLEFLKEIVELEERKWR
ncbi:ribosome small subunit-dependent GTPase A [Vulcanibacillus modesticaldus]|uniref:Small ribosomal subunit biogenesis GTPase RsgA n=1 Tax=Vulcanibacillus modesticaldus TaxID=337097 RepID=A0A1D2YTR8_9BACI|nr:ribosome small subunit-dependent GTPase A [Vulcanibacillus modesticaldus]OEF99079.1 ribosome small subunit-dependent GTPase A [Vulcanibacillus modesticaldus]